jgi:CheY-like chemotaxis protein
VQILLAEDNEINQEVANEIIAKAGASLDIVENGKLAVQAVLKKRYDLVLMDCQMPEMDGFEATGKIREYEKEGKVLHKTADHLTIIAMTANAVKGDKELCIAAGMDDYLSKPIEPKELINMINSKLPEEDTGDKSKQEIATVQNIKNNSEDSDGTINAQDKPFNMDSLLERCMGNQDFLEKILKKFQDKALKDLADIEQSLQDGDTEQLRLFSHGLKGAAANLSAQSLRQAASEMEQLAKAKDLTNAQEYLEKLKNELNRCLNYLPNMITS